MNIIEEIKKKAKSEIRTIVLPEAEDTRVIEAANIIEKEGFAKIVLIGNTDKVKSKAKENGIDLTNISVVDPETSEKFEEYANCFYELRKAKGITEEDARNYVSINYKDRKYFSYKDNGKYTTVKYGRCRWIGIRSGTFNFGYAKACTSNIKNSSRNQVSFSIFLNECAKLRIW